MKDKITEYLEFQELDVPERKTQVFEIRNHKTDFFIGTIEWDCGWRRYVFCWSGELGKLDKLCLDEISEFIGYLMEERKLK